MPKIPKKISIIISNLDWMSYLPADEREHILYGRAYRRAFFTLLILQGLLYEFFITLELGPDLPFLQFFNTELSVTKYSFFFIIIMVIANLAGWTALAGEELSGNRPRFFTSHPILAFAIIAIFMLSLVIFYNYTQLA